MAALSDGLLGWASEMAGARLEDVVSLHLEADRESGSFHLRMAGGDVTDLVLKVPVPNSIGPRMIATNARALQLLAAKFSLSAPRLVAADLDGRTTGIVATLETWLPGSSALPPVVSVTRLRSAGAALAEVHAVSVPPEERLQIRPRPVADDDFAADRREGRMDTTALLQQADELTGRHGVPKGELVFVHGDAWPGNMLFDGDICTALIDWKTAGVGDPGVDLGGFRLQMAMQYGPGAPDEVLHGWQDRSGRGAASISYWDAIAALNTPTELSGFPGFAADGSRLDAAAVTQRRDAFLRAALDRLTT